MEHTPARQESPEATVRFVLEDWNPGRPVRAIRIALEPRDLGALRVTLQHRQGQVHARMVVENAAALRAVQAQVATLQRTLAEQGLHFGTFSITAATNAASTGLPLGPARGALENPERRESSAHRRSGRHEVTT